MSTERNGAGQGIDTYALTKNANIYKWIHVSPSGRLFLSREIVALGGGTDRHEEFKSAMIREMEIKEANTSTGNPE